MHRRTGGRRVARESQLTSYAHPTHERMPPEYRRFRGSGRTPYRALRPAIPVSGVRNRGTDIRGGGGEPRGKDRPRQALTDPVGGSLRALKGGPTPHRARCSRKGGGP